jgi:hypothetical protein
VAVHSDDLSFRSAGLNHLHMCIYSAVHATVILFLMKGAAWANAFILGSLHFAWCI